MEVFKITINKLCSMYAEKCISLVPARKRGIYYLSIKNTPTCVQGLPEGVCQLTGHLTIYSRDRLNDVDSMVKTVHEEYKRQFADNPIMLSYVQ